MAYETYYDDDGKPETVYVKEEPDCYTCNDSRYVLVDAGGHVRKDWDYGGALWQTTCPECNPSPEQIAARDAAYAELVAAGKANFDDEPPF